MYVFILRLLVYFSLIKYVYYISVQIDYYIVISQLVQLASMSVDPHSQRFLLTFNHVQSLLSEDRSNQQISKLSIQILDLICSTHECVLDHKACVEIIELLIVKSTQMVSFEKIDTLLRLFDISRYPPKKSSHFKFDKKGSTNTITSYFETGVQKMKKPILKKDFQNYLYLEDVVKKLVFQQFILDRMKTNLGQRTIGCSSITNILLITQLLLEYMEAGEMPQTIINGFHEIENMANLLIYSWQQNINPQEMGPLIALHFNVRRQLFANQPSFTKDFKLYKFQVFRKLIQDEQIEKGLQFYHRQLSQQQQLGPFAKQIQQIVLDSLDKIIFSDYSGQRQAYESLFQLGLEDGRIQHHQVERILQKKSRPLYQILLLNVCKLADDDIIKVLNHFGSKNEILEAFEVDFIANLIPTQKEVIVNSVIDLYQKLCGKYNQIFCVKCRYFIKTLVRFRNHHQSLDFTVRQLKFQLKLFQQKCRTMLAYRKQFSVQIIEMHISNIYQKISKRLDHQSIVKQIKSLQIFEFLQLYVSLIKKSDQNHNEIMSIFNTLLQQQLLSHDKNLSNIIFTFSEVVIQTNFDAMYQDLKKYRHLYQYVCSQLLLNSSLLRVETITQLMLNSLLYFSVNQKQKIILSRIDMISKLIFKQFNRGDLIQYMIIYVECLPCNYQQKFGSQISKVFQRKISDNISLNIESAVKNVNLLYAFITKAWRIQAVRPKIQKTLYRSIFNLLSYPELESKAYQILLVFDIPQDFISILANSIEDLKNLSNINTLKFSYLMRALSIHRNNQKVMSNFMIRPDRYFEELIIIYTNHFKKRQTFKLEEKQAFNKIIGLINILIQECFQIQHIKQLYCQLDSLSVDYVSTFVKNNPYSLRRCSFYEVVCKFCDGLYLQQNDLKHVQMEQSCLLGFFYFLKYAQNPRNQSMQQLIYQFAQASKDNVKIWIFMVNYVAQSKQTQIQVCLSKFKQRKINLIWCVKYVLLYQTNSQQLFERLYILFTILQGETAKSNLWRIIIELVFDIMSKQCYFSSSQCDQLFQKANEFVERLIFPTQNSPQQILYKQDLQNVYKFFRVMQYLTEKGSYQNQKTLIILIEKIFISSGQEIVELRQKIIPIKFINFMKIPALNMIISLFTTAQAFVEEYLKIEFQESTHPQLISFQTLLMNMLFTNSSSVSCFEAIKQFGIFAKGHWSCLNYFNYLFQEIIVKRKNKQLISLFHSFYTKQKICACQKDINAPTMQTFSLNIDNFYQQKITQGQFIDIEYTQFYQFCEFCFLPLEEICKFEKMARYLIFWVNLNLSTSDHLLFKCKKFKGIDLKDKAFNINYLLIFMIFQYEQIENEVQLYCARFYGENWHLTTNQTQQKFSSLFELINYCKSLNNCRIICQMYEREQLKYLDYEFSSTGLTDLSNILRQNQTNFIQNLAIYEKFEHIIANVVEFYLFNQRIYQANNEFQEYLYQFTIFVQIYLQRFVVKERMDEHFTFYLQSIVDGMKQLLRQGRCMSFNQIFKNIKQGNIDRIAFYQKFIMTVAVSCFQEQEALLYQLQLNPHQNQQNIYQVYYRIRDYLFFILNPMLQALDEQKHGPLIIFTIHALARLCSQFKKEQAKVHLLNFIIKCSIVSTLIKIFIMQYCSLPISEQLYPHLFPHSQVKFSLNLDTKIHIITIISFMLRFKCENQVVTQDSQENKLSISDQRQLLNTKFIQIIMKSMPALPPVIEFLESLLIYFSKTENQIVKAKCFYRITTIFLENLYLNQQDNQMKQNIIVFQFILKNISRPQQLEILFGYYVLNCRFSIFNIDGCQSDYLNLIDILVNCKSVYNIFFIHQLLSFIEQVFPDMKRHYCYCILRLFTMLEEIQDKLKQQPHFFDNCQVEIQKITPIFQFSHKVMKQIFDIYTLQQDKNVEQHHIKIFNKVTALQNKQFVKNWSFQKEKIHINLFSYDIAIKQRKNVESNLPKQRKLKKYVQIFEVHCSCEKQFEYLIQFNVQKCINCCGPAQIYLKNSKCHKQSSFKKIVIFRKQDPHQFISLQNCQIFIK